MAVPVITNTVPADDATGIAINASFYAQFSEALSETTVTDQTVVLTIKATMSTVPIAVSYNPATYIVTVTPYSNLNYGTTYFIVFSNGIYDASGLNAMSTVSFEFTTDSAPTDTSDDTDPLDITPGVPYDSDGLHIVRTYPENKASGVVVTGCMASGEPPLQYIDVEFNNNLDPDSIVSGPNFEADQDERGPAIRVIGRAALKYPTLEDQGRVEGIISLKDSKTIRFRFV